MAKRQAMKKKSVNFVPAANNRLPEKIYGFLSFTFCIFTFHVNVLGYGNMAIRQVMKNSLLSLIYV